MRLFTNAVVHTLDPARPRAEAILTDGEAIAAVGGAEELAAHAAGRLEETVDLRGAPVIPGLVDAHLHAMSYAESLAQVDLRQARSEAQAVEAIAAYARTLPDGVWVGGGRWDCNRWKGGVGQPGRALLDAAVPDRPVAVWSIDYHTLWCNGAALRAAGIDASTPSPRGGEIVRDAEGHATGILREDAATLVERQVPHAPRELGADRMAAAQRAWLAEGLTGVHDIDGELSREAWLALRERGGLDMRVVKYLRLEEFDWAVKTGWRTGGGDAWFHHGGLKLFSDGALGSQSAFMSSAYPHAAGAPAAYGMQIATEDVLVSQIETALSHGIGTAIHAIGDQANHHVLSAYARTQEANRAAEARFGSVLRRRIEHAQFVQPADVARFGQLGIVASMQPRHCISDLHLLAALRPDERLAAYAWGELAAAGAPLAFGSDGPVEPSNPFAAIYAAMTRADIEGDPATSFQPERRISARAALEAHTSGAAYAAGREACTGRLAPGMEADFIALDVDPLVHPGLDPETGAYGSEDALFDHACAIRDARVLVAAVGGTVRHAL
ncbi:amidohydrolase [Brevibacterium sp. BRM-1]|uniref:amidohydrolase n=1 Tax=Brevibacterium sp. BRM-1 TaxID=2999062 RepID=UPI002280373F|nr:amidohydrolase [Brevibacterium sp. BRM-1]WAL39374.1 amidohydrolase [Brevibacterium sp. BRM-1]